MSHLFLDCDGVLADFNAHYETHFGSRLTRETPTDCPDMWNNIRSVKTFYRDMPPMSDARELWDGVKHLKPTILTGVPYHQIPDAETQKRAWALEHFGDVPVLCCRSADKKLHGRPLDVLVDDWDRYRHLWVQMGGIWIQHYSARESLQSIRLLEAHGAFR